VAAYRPTGWIPALAGAIATAQGAVLLVRPRGRLIDPAPVAVTEHFSREEVRRARRYGRPQLALQLVAGAVETATLIVLVRRRPRWLRGPHRRPRLAGAAAGAGLSAGLTVAPLPLSALMLKRARDAGLATQTWRGWAQDLLKATAIGSILSAGGAGLALELMRRYRRDWWMPGAAGSVAIGAAFTFAAPVVLEPIFNRFTPLPEGQTRDDVLELARAAGVKVKGVYEVDASRRTRAANAYVSGLGSTRRVVLFDTLMKAFTRDEARLVVAHELAHVHHRDVPRGLLYAALVAPASLHAAARLTERLDGSGDPGPATLPALALSFGVVTGAVSTIAKQLSRRIERRADLYSLKLTDAPEALISLQRRIAVQNLADPDPPRWLAVLLGTHPPIIKRIGAAKAYAERAQTTPEVD
jgi:STE24 endopeptidase